MPKPSIKGSVFAKVVEDVKKLVDQDEGARASLAEKLSPDELALLEGSISPAGWYSIETYTGMTQVLLHFEGGGDFEYLTRRGAETAERLIEAGVYAQFAYLDRTQASQETDPAARFAAYGRDLRLLATLSSSILNFSSWTPTPDPDHERRWMLELTDAFDYPDILAHTTAGMMNRMSQKSQARNLWRWERVSHDTIHFRMSQDV